MKILLVHPDDAPDRGPWGRRARAGQSWDRVIDLGKGGSRSYERWTRQFGCPVVPFDSLRFGLEELREVRAVLTAGVGRLLDRENLDWWELTAILFHQQLDALGVLRRFATELVAADQLYITRPGFYADALKLLLGNRLHCFAPTSNSHVRGPRHYLRVASKFPLAQLGEIFWDKFDASYSIRGMFYPRRKPSCKPVVLLPSAYVNVSSTGIAYAETVPETNFLLVATRRSGWMAAPPDNVTVAKLASYAPKNHATNQECAELLVQWRALRRDLEFVPEIGMLGRLGFLDQFPKLLRQGLAIRDAWRVVFDAEPIKAVLCADDSNPYTHIPLLLAAKRGISTIACHHGALDGRHLIKRNHADVILAKGKMEEDYLLKVCGLPTDRVEVGAPARPPSVGAAGLAREPGPASCIVLFSEPYEVAGGRCGEFYRDLLPGLADLALETSRKLIVKLHPFESRRERERLVKSVLSPAQQQVATVMTGPLKPDLLRKTWFGITILSTVATECASSGVPCFLCGWLEYSPYGYVQQFSRFGVGHVLQSASQISEIPRVLETYTVRPELARDLWQPITPDRLRELLTGTRKRDIAIAV